MLCPNCGAQAADYLKFCAHCGAALKPEAPTVSLTKEPAAPAAAEPVPAAAEPAPVTAAPVSVPAAPARKRFSPKSIVSMILGLSGLGFATAAVIYQIAGLVAMEGIRALGGTYRYRDYYAYSSDYTVGAAFAVLAVVFAVIGIGCAIPALILSPRGMREGTAPGNHGMAKCGKVTGVITIVFCAIAIVLACISFAGLV